MLSKSLKLLEKKTSPSGILLIGAIIVALICSFNPQPSVAGTAIPLPSYSAKSKIIFDDKTIKDADRKVKWCNANKECMVLAEAVVYEARSESEMGKTSVAHVIMARVRDGRWGDSIRDVVYQRHQFSYTMKRQKSKPTKKDWNSAKEVAFDVMNGYIDSPVGVATHYHTKKVRPTWAKKLQYVATVDNHIFYR